MSEPMNLQFFILEVLSLPLRFPFLQVAVANVCGNPATFSCFWRLLVVFDRIAYLD